MLSKRTKKPQLNDHFSVMKYLVLLAVLVIPSIYAGILTWANYDPTGRIDTVPAAIVNEDQTAQPAGGEAVKLGDDITDELLSNTSTSNFKWQTMNADEAETALEKGEVMAVLTIPADFSAKVTSVTKNDAATAARAQLNITTNDGSNLVAGNIASALGTAVTDGLKEKVSAQYLDNIYAGFTNIHDSLGQAADGATQLADGFVKAADGGDQLVVGLGDLKTGADSLATGSSDLASSAASARDGAAQVSSGASSAAEGAASLSTGAASVNDGAGSLATGLGELNTQVSALPGQADALAAGTQSLADGASSVATGATQTKDGAAQLSAGATQVADGSAAALEGAQKLNEGAAALNTGAGALVDGANGVSAGAQSLMDNWGVLTDEQKLAALTELKTGADAVAAGATSAQTATGQLAAGTSALVGDENSGLTKLSAGAGSLAQGASSLAEGTVTLSDGAAQLSTGAAQLNEKASALPGGMDTLSSAVAQAASGADSLAAGTDQLAGGASSLASGTEQLSSGASSLADGTGKLADGSATLADGASKLDSGAASALDGANSLTQGLGDLKDGNGKLATSLADAVGQVPSYTGDQSSELSAVTSNPVELNKTRLNEVSTYGHGLAPYFMSLGLWVGAIAYFMMYPAISRRFARSGHSGLSTLVGSLIPMGLVGAVQGMVVALVLHFWVDINMASFWGIAGFSMLTSVTFLAINQALIALLDAPGRFIALMLTVLQVGASGGTYPIETAPGFLRAVHPWLPLTHSLEGMRSLIAGGNLGVLPGVFWLLGWLLVAVAATALSIWLRHRREERADAERAARRAEMDGGVLPVV